MTELRLILPQTDSSQNTPAPGPSDAALMARTKAGDQAAFRDIVLRYEAAIRGLLVAMTGHEAEDLTQEVFTTLWTKRHRYQEQGGFLELEDGELRRADLLDLIQRIQPSGAHVILDACNGQAQL